MRVADTLGIRTGIVRAAINADAARCAAKNFTALRGEFIGGQPVTRSLMARGLMTYGPGLRGMWRGQNDQARNKARENGKSSCPHHLRCPFVVSPMGGNVSD